MQLTTSKELQATRSEDSMLKSFLSLFTPDPIKKISKVKDRKYKEAVHLQRSGDLRAYAQVMNEITMLEEELVRLCEERDEK